MAVSCPVLMGARTTCCSGRTLPPTRAASRVPGTRPTVAPGTIRDTLTEPVRSKENS